MNHSHFLPPGERTNCEKTSQPLFKVDDRFLPLKIGLGKSQWVRPKETANLHEAVVVQWTVVPMGQNTWIIMLALFVAYNLILDKSFSLSEPVFTSAKGR